MKSPEKVVVPHLALLVVRRIMSCRCTMTILFVLIGVFLPEAFGQETAPETLTDLAAWAPITLKVPVHKKLSGYFQIQPRWNKLAEKHFTEVLMRTGLSYDLNERFSIAGGYYLTSRFNPYHNREWRLWQEMNYKHKFKRLTVENRFRLEEMYREIKWDGALVRYRNQLKVAYPIRKTRWYLVGSEEPFFFANSPEHGPKIGFTQNRIFVGVGRHLNRATKIETGYLNKFHSGQDIKPDVVTHAIVANVTVDLRKLDYAKLKWRRRNNWRLAQKTRKRGSEQKQVASSGTGQTAKGVISGI